MSRARSRTAIPQQLKLPSLTVVAAVLLAATLAPGRAAEVSGEPDSPDGFGVTAFLAGPATFTDTVSGDFEVTYDGGRTLIANLPQDAATIAVEVAWEPRGSSGWHTHPGPAIVNVTEGEVTVTNANDCVPHTYGPGEAFVDPGPGNVHRATNASDTREAKAVVTFLGVPTGSPATIMAPAADCVESHGLTSTGFLGPCACVTRGVWGS